MNQSEQRILIYSGNTDTVDAVVSLCEQCDSSRLRIAICDTPQALEDQFEHRKFALAFVDMDNGVSPQMLDEIAVKISPKPTIAIVSGSSTESLLEPMRNGADSVFTQQEMAYSPTRLVYCLERQLQRAARIDEVEYLRDTLSRSLEQLKSDQIAAREIQERMLPKKEQRIGQMTIAYAMKPSMVLSGDFVDTIKLREGKCLFYLADVSGHGASSALVTVLLKSITNRILRSYNRGKSKTLEDPLALLALFNRELLLTSLGKHLTIFVGLIDQTNAVMDYAVGGHHPMPILVQQGEGVMLSGRGMPIGLFEEPEFEHRQIPLSGPFRLFLFSDGILEIIKGDNLSDKEQNLRVLCEQAGQTPAKMLEIVSEGRDSLPDDVAVMMVAR